MRRPCAHRRTRAALTLASLPLALALAGCGGRGGDSSAATTPAAGSSTTAASTSPNPTKQQLPGTAQDSPSDSVAQPPGPPARAFQPKPHHDSGGGSAQFVVKGADNSVQEFGAEASESELQAAAGALHDFLDARAERNWAAACGYLSAETKRSFAQLPAGASQSCAVSLAALSGKVPNSTLKEAAIADVGSLRAQGAQGFLIYRGAPKGTIYAIPVAKEGGSWKVASLAGTPLN